MVELRPHGVKVVLVEPEIPQNAGNIARLCAVTGAELHLVKPLGFFLGGRHLKRAGMDYWERVKVVVHEDVGALRAAMGGGRYWLCSAKGQRIMWETGFEAGDWLVFGRETTGLPAEWLEAEKERGVRIPMVAGERCLNLATAAGVVLFEVLRQVHYK